MLNRRGITLNKRNYPFVISISGVSGGGKTTITKRLNKKLTNSKVLFFDDYDVEGPIDIIEWVNKGAAYDEWNLDEFFVDLKELIDSPLEYIILDYPFAYKHAKIKSLIDLAVYIDTPLDIAMARRIIRDYNNRSKESILNEMEHYISRGRRGYFEMIQSIKPSSDFIVDGTLPPSIIVDKIYHTIINE